MTMWQMLSLELLRRLGFSVSRFLGYILFTREKYNEVVSVGLTDQRKNHIVLIRIYAEGTKALRTEYIPQEHDHRYLSRSSQCHDHLRILEYMANFFRKTHEGKKCLEFTETKAQYNHLCRSSHFVFPFTACNSSHTQYQSSITTLRAMH